MSIKIQPLNRDLASERVSMVYPYLKVLDPSDAVALVLPGLDKGDLPVLCTYNGKTRKLASISDSAIMIDRLRRVSRIAYVTAEGQEMELKTVYDIMEVI